jgi:hypothetical protein
MLARSISFEAMDSRRSTREFSDRPVPREVENLIKRHLQPLLVHTSNHGLLRRWKSRNQKKKNPHAEEEEMLWISHVEWLARRFKTLGTDWRKPFRNRSFLIISDEYMNLMAKKRKQLLRSRKCIAAGFLLAAIHQVGLVLTHTLVRWTSWPKPLADLKMKNRFY